MNINSKITIFMFPALIAISAATTAYFYTQKNHDYLNYSLQQSKIETSALEQKIKFEIAQREDGFMTVLEDIYASGEFNVSYISAWFRPDYPFELIFVDESGKPVVISQREQSSDKDAFNEIFERVKAGNYLQSREQATVVHPSSTNHLEISYVEPVQIDGKFYGHIIFNSLIPVWQNLLKEINTKDNVVLLFNQDREIAAKNVNSVNPWRTSPKEIGNMLAAKMADRYSSITLDNTKFLAIGSQVNKDLTLAYMLPETRFEEFKQKNIRDVVFPVIVINLIFLLIFLHCVHLQIVKPLSQLRLFASDLESGRLESALPEMEKFSEFTSLTNSLDKLRRKIKQFHSDSFRLINQDALTGLPNRRAIMERLDLEIERHKRNPGAYFALLFIDLDNFKFVNDSMGHKAGDRLVIKVGERLIESVRAYDCVSINRTTSSDTENNNYVARLGGDEFLMIINDIDDTLRIANIVNRIYKVFKDPIYLDEILFHVNMSVGISVYPGNGETAEELIKNSDVAMYNAKSSGKNQFKFYDSVMDSNTRESLEIETNLRKALANDGLTLYFQPQFLVNSHEIHGAEVLIRWHDEERGWIPPDKFIQIAEACGLIHELGDWILMKCMSLMKQWYDSGINVPLISINVSSHQIGTNGFADKVIELLNQFKIPAASIELELTETAILKNKEVTTRNLEQLRKIGCKIALDDFGTGYSSLAWLQYCSVDSIKIDRSFVTDLSEHTTHKAIIASVVELCNRLGINSIAEGVETDLELDEIRKLKCDIVQGYYFSPPVPEDKFLDKFIDSAIDVHQVSSVG